MDTRFGNLVKRIAALAGGPPALAFGLVAFSIPLLPAAAHLLHSPAAPTPLRWVGLAMAQATCGDGILDPGEQCDDGNNQDGDCCSATCQFESAGSPCNDGNQCTDPDVCDGAGKCVGGPPVICPDFQCQQTPGCDPFLGCAYSQQPDGTPCDDGIACSFNDQCVGGICSGTVPTCGDGIVETQGGCEQCDDGNTQAGDGCNGSCRLERVDQTCEAAVVRAVPWSMRRLKLVQRCRNGLNRGAHLYFDRERTLPLTDPADCPNEYSAVRYTQLWNRVAARIAARPCTDTLIGGLGLCAGTVDGLIGDTGCLLDATAAATDAMIAQEFGALTVSDPALATCQSMIAGFSGGYTNAVLTSFLACRTNLIWNRKVFYDQARTQRLRDPADCPLEFRTGVREVNAAIYAHQQIANYCTDAQVGSLGLCAATLDGLIAPDGSGGCLVTSLTEQVNALIGGIW